MCAMWMMLLILYEQWIPCTGHRFVQHCIALNLYHGVPWCWPQHIIYVVSTLIKVFVINCGVLCSSINCRVAPIKHSVHFKSHYFECLSFLLCVLHWIVELCADSAVQCVRMCGRRRREELQKVDATLYYIKCSGLTHPNFLAGQTLNLQNSTPRH